MLIDAPAQRLTVISAANTAYFPGLVVTLYSALRHLAPGWAVDFKVLTDALDEREETALRQTLRATGREHTLEILELNLEDFEGLPALHGSKLAYARLMIPELVAAERAVYLDADIVVTKDLSELTRLPWVAGQMLHAVQDGRIGTFASDWETIPGAALGIPPNALYFNSGFLWMDLAEWRRQAVREDCRAYAERFPDGVRWHDQSVLNAVLWNRWRPLDGRWNAAPERTLSRWTVYPFRAAQDVNVHYLAKNKPWAHMHPLDYFYRSHAAEIMARVPGALTLRKRERWEWVRRLRYFVLRAGWHYGRFLLRR